MKKKLLLLCSICLVTTAIACTTANPTTNSTPALTESAPASTAPASTEQTSTEPASTERAPMEPASTEQASTEGTYAFEDKSASINIPDIWKENVTFKPLVKEEGAAYSTGVTVVFTPKEIIVDKEETIATIRVYDESKWKELDETEKMGESELLVANGRVYSYSTPQSCPFPDGSAEADLFNSLVIPANEAASKITITSAS